MGNQQATLAQVISPTFKVGSRSASYEACFKAFEESQYGQHQATQQTRFHKRYTYDEAEMRQDLGDDVHPVYHMAWTHDEIAMPLLEAQVSDTSAEQPTESDIVSIRLAALTHDIGECEHPKIKDELGMIVGDKLYGTITTQDKVDEKMVRDFVVARIGTPHVLLPVQQLAALESTIDNANPDRFADATFYTCERAGYYGTALAAGQIVLNEIGSAKPENDRHYQLSRLAVDVSDHRNFLETQRKRYPFIDQLLLGSRALHAAIHSEIAPALKTTTEAL